MDLGKSTAIDLISDFLVALSMPSRDTVTLRVTMILCLDITHIASLSSLRYDSNSFSLAGLDQKTRLCIATGNLALQQQRDLINPSWTTCYDYGADTTNPR